MEAPHTRSVAIILFSLMAWSTIAGAQDLLAGVDVGDCGKTGYEDVCIQNQILAYSQPDILQKATDKCKAKWPGDYRMQSYCIDQQSTAVTWITNWLQSDKILDHTVVANISHGCLKKWPDDFNMTKYCIDNQAASYIKIHGAN